VILCTTTLVPNRDPLRGEQVLGFADAAASAGFDGVWLWDMHHEWAVADGISSDAFVAHHRDLGLDIPCVEVIMDWAQPDDSPASERTLTVAAQVGARSVVVLTPAMPPIADAAKRLAALCDRAADRGLGVSVEPVPWHGVPDTATAEQLLDATDRDNLGIVLDLWHWQRRPGGPDLDALRRFPADRIDYVQLDDALADPWPEALIETLTARELPGYGCIDIDAVLDVLDANGATPPMAAEVFSTKLTELGPAAMAAAVFDASDAVLARRHA
jgi:sugar phosphate isomerase/epimerase